MKLKQLFIAGLLIIASTPAFASTVQQPASTVIEAKPDGKGNVIISWTGETRPFTRLERYIGHGRKTGHVAGILIPAGTHQAILKNVKGDGDDSKPAPLHRFRFNLQVSPSEYLHLECGGNTTTTQPTLKGLHVDGSYVNPQSGQVEGALEVDESVAPPAN
ncbi:MAG: hypothetical protein WCL23_02575 [Candidatus Moraniibacteriota bacterium]